jgi:hypothetical protein
MIICAGDADCAKGPELGFCRQRRQGKAFTATHHGAVRPLWQDVAAVCQLEACARVDELGGSEGGGLVAHQAGEGGIEGEGGQAAVLAGADCGQPQQGVESRLSTRATVQADAQPRLARHEAHLT